MTEADETEELTAAGATNNSDKKDKKKKQAPQASVSETLSFAFTSGTQTSVIFFVGILGALGNGAVSE